MASSLALRRAAAAASGAFSGLAYPLRAASVAPGVARSFNTSSQMRRYDDDNDVDASDSGDDVSRRPDRFVSRRRHQPGLFSGSASSLSFRWCLR